MMQSYLYLFPLAFCALIPTAFFLSFAVAYGLGHLHEDFFTAVANIGSYPPEQCYFSQFANLATFAYIGVVYIRYKQFELFHNCILKTETNRKNKAVLIVGLMSASGAFIVANFQKSNLLHIHSTGVFFSLFFGTIWICFQTHFSVKLQPYFGSKGILQVRVFLCLLGCLTYICFQPSSIYASVTSKSNIADEWRIVPVVRNRTATNSLNTESTWTAHAVAVVLEWLTLLIYDIYIGTLIPEFRYIFHTDPEFSFDGIPETSREELPEADVQNDTSMTSVSDILEASPVST